MAEQIKWTMGDWCIDTASIKGTHGETVAYIERQSNGNVPSGYTASDEEWQSIIDQIAAVPEMIAVLKRADSVVYEDMDVVEAWMVEVRAVLRKAEKPRKVKRVVEVVVEVEVEDAKGIDIDILMSYAEDSVVIQGGSDVRALSKRARGARPA